MQYKTEPDKVKNSNIDKNATEIWDNSVVRKTASTVGIIRQDIVTILTEIKNEVINGQ